MNYLTQLAHAIREELPPGALPDEPVDDLLLSYAVLTMAVGAAVTPADVHDAWVAWMIPRDPEHPALVPYEDLQPETADEDSPFVAAIRSVALTRKLGRRPGAP